MTNVGLGNVPPPLEYGVLDSFQGLPSIPNVNAVGKGWNEFVLFGDSSYENEFGVQPDYYYLYTGMTWINENRGGVLEEDGSGRGLFFQNFVDNTVEGWFCTRDNTAYYNWLCESTHISDFYWDPSSNRMPINREATSLWICGAEDRNTYTQA